MKQIPCQYIFLVKTIKYSIYYGRNGIFAQQASITDVACTKPVPGEDDPGFLAVLLQNGQTRPEYAQNLRVAAKSAN